MKFQEYNIQEFYYSYIIIYNISQDELGRQLAYHCTIDFFLVSAFIQTDSELRYLVDGAPGNHFAEVSLIVFLKITLFYSK